jgi:hypothetical protein
MMPAAFGRRAGVAFLDDALSTSCGNVIFWRKLPDLIASGNVRSRG